MGAFQAIPKYFAVVVLLFVFACHEVVLTRGRQIKAKNQNSSLDKQTSINGNVPTSAKKIVHSPTTQNRHAAVAGFGDSDAENTNAFRPTTPGNSPGVGHRKFEDDNKQYYSLTEGSQTDFKPTKPGHSSGVGHAASPNNKN